MAGSKDISRQFELIIARAVMDEEFRDRLLSDKPSIVAEYELSKEDSEALGRVDAKSLQEARELGAMIPVVHLLREDQE